jgi:hypothetical protein
MQRCQRETQSCTRQTYGWYKQIKKRPMKKTTLVVCAAVCVIALNANSLLLNPQTGQPVATGNAEDIELVSNGTDVVLIIANNSAGQILAIDILDNNPADSALNVVSSPVPNFTANLSAALGIPNVNILNFEVNPISKSIYVLVRNLNTGLTTIAKVTNNGNTITPLALTNVSFSAITYSASPFTVQDMTWGNNTLFVSTANSQLDGEIGMITAPFANNTSSTNRATSMFKSNWGNSYITSAPLERMGWSNVAGNERLMGVTTCAPGFSVRTADVPGSGVLQVTEDFNMVSMPTVKVIPVTQNGVSYLLDLHMGFTAAHPLYRIGEMYLDGSQVAANAYNATAHELRDWNGNPSPGFTTDQIMQYAGTFKMAAFYTNYDLLVLDDLDNLKLYSVGTVSTGTAENTNASFSVFPNPVSETMTLRYHGQLSSNSVIVIATIEGQEVLRQPVNPVGDQLIDITSLAAGNYVVSIIGGQTVLHAEKFSVK